MGSSEGEEGSCIAPLTPYGNMAVKLAAPMGMCFMLFVVMAYTKLWYKEKWQAWNHIRTGMSVFLFIYVPVADSVLRYLNCIPVGDSRVVASNPAINCDDPEYQFWGSLVYFTLIFFVIGGPMVLFWFLRKNYLAGRLLENDFAHRYDIMYNRFKVESYYWIVTQLARRTVLVALVAFIQERGQRFAYISFTQLFFVVIHTHTLPYKLASENAFEFVALTFLLLLTISLGSYPFPYTIGVQALLSMILFLPALGFIGFLVYENVRAAFHPTEAETKAVRDFNRAMKRGLRTFKEKHGELDEEDQRAYRRKRKKKKKKKLKKKLRALDSRRQKYEAMLEKHTSKLERRERRRSSRMGSDVSWMTGADEAHEEDDIGETHADDIDVSLSNVMEGPDFSEKSS